ncbi:hypothetical protein C1H46_012073 [Malus baccata]|uniref:Uncharacterized protein n=1 Tax=Malus baccata TaxID=106549 RepID=A0A540MU34_MALBA|nr:hypothetical protein C1H46_012073 [Malus baccata]
MSFGDFDFRFSADENHKFELTFDDFWTTLHSVRGKIADSSHSRSSVCWDSWSLSWHDLFFILVNVLIVRLGDEDDDIPSGDGRP